MSFRVVKVFSGRKLMIVADIVPVVVCIHRTFSFAGGGSGWWEYIIIIILLIV